eukprot:275836-Rhodomonas_salina.1
MVLAVYPHATRSSVLTYCMVMPAYALASVLTWRIMLWTYAFATRSPVPPPPFSSSHSVSSSKCTPGLSHWQKSASELGVRAIPDSRERIEFGP